MENGRRSAPEHPLPAEIRAMARDETVCKYCGVSYLIHNEIKALEDKLRNCEKELKHLRGREDREAMLQQSLDESSREIETLQQTISAKSDIIENQAKHLSSSNLMITELQAKLTDSQSVIKSLEEEVTHHKHKASSLHRALPHLVTIIQDLRKNYQDVRKELRNSQNDFHTELRTAMDRVSHVSAEQSTEREGLLEEVAVLRDAQAAGEDRERQLRTEVDRLTQQSVQLQSSQEHVRELEHRLTALQQQAREYKDDLRRSNLETEKVVQENKELSSRLHIAQNETQTIQSEAEARGDLLNETNDNLRLELRSKDDQLDELRNKLESLKGEYLENQRSQEEIKRRAFISNSAKRELDEELRRIRGDCEALKNEREMMITAHQEQILQLRESFKNRMSEADRWPKRLEEALRAERASHGAALEEQERRLVAAHHTELDIERERHRQLLEKTRNEMRESEKQLRAQLATASASRDGEVTDLHRALAEQKARGRDTETALREEVGSLKGSVRDLEARLGKVDVTSDAEFVRMKMEMSELRSQLETSTQERKRSDSQLSQAKEQITLLQDTVRRECEERFELTEALGEAKEELLQLRKPPGGYRSSRQSSPSSRRNSTQLASLSNTTPSLTNKSPSPSNQSLGSRSEEMALYKHTGRQGNRAPEPRAPQPPATGLAAEVPTRKIVNPEPFPRERRGSATDTGKPGVTSDHESSQKLRRDDRKRLLSLYK